MRNDALITRLKIAAVAVGVAGCTVHPPGERAERTAAFKAGTPYADRIEARTTSALPEQPTADQLVEHALLSNAELERRYWEWRSAIEQIPQDGTQTTTLNVSAGTSLTRGRAGWGSSAVSLSNDPMTDIKWPGKFDRAAQQSLDNARAAGRRFVKAKYDLREKVLAAYYDYALTAELIRLEQRNAQLLEITALATAVRSRTGTAGQQDVMKSSNELDLSRNDIATMQTKLAGERAAINALLNRPADAALPVPDALPATSPLAYDDSQLVNLAAKDNPELAALADEINGRQEGLQLARLQYIPDFNLSAGTDLLGITQSVLAQATIPAFRYEALNAAIAQAESNLRATESMRRQAVHNLAAEVVTDITAVRDADRQLALFDQAILPRAKQIIAIGRSAYETGHGTLPELLDDQRSVITIERLVANLKIVRLKQLADLEAITATRLSTAN